jgi:hypothetical protein
MKPLPYPNLPSFPLWQKYLACLPAYFTVLAIWYGAGVNSQDNIGNFALLGMVIFMLSLNHYYQKKSDREYDQLVFEWKQQFKPPPQDVSYGTAVL